MIKRILTALGMLAVLFGFLLGLRQIHVAFATGLVGVLTIFAAYEMCHALKQAEYKTMSILVMLTAVAAVIATYFAGYLGLVCAIMISVLIAATIFTFVHSYELKDLFATIFIMAYPIIPLCLLVQMNNESYGFYAIWLTLIIPIMTDTMAYFSGVLIGGKKLCPDISPKKTIAGAIGGVVGAVVGALIIFLAFDYGNIFESIKNVTNVAITEEYWKSILIYISLGIIAGPVCEIGDLAASWIKRKAGIKDYGNIFPGHGGIMDRLDSIVFMVPITCVFVAIMQL